LLCGLNPRLPRVYVNDASSRLDRMPPAVAKETAGPVDRERPAQVAIPSHLS
jgi:hypothetical protein